MIYIYNLSNIKIIYSNNIQTKYFNVLKNLILKASLFYNFYIAKYYMILILLIFNLIKNAPNFT